MKLPFKLFILFCFPVINSFGGNHVSPGVKDSSLQANVHEWMQKTSGLRFTENKGQMADMQGKPVNNLLFKACGGGVDIYVTTSGLSYVFTKLDRHKQAEKFPGGKFHKPDSITVQYCRADMELLGADIRKENIIKEGESEDRADYYLGGVCPDGILGVHSYSRITIKNIYPGIDWVLYSQAKGLKYDFVVHPGANPSSIRLKYKWTDKPELQNDGSVLVGTPMGKITEGIPISHEGEDKVRTNYFIKNNEIGFTLDKYNNNAELTIDPSLVWATYYGETWGDEDLYSLQDDGKNVWATGTALSTNFATFNPGSGAYFQGTFVGAQEAFILEFSVTGVLEWATYYGAGSGDVGESIYSDGTNVWVAGYTGSIGFPTFNPGGGTYFQPNLGTGATLNTFILQFSTTGVRKWATYYGGSKEDFGSSIQSDGKNVWVCGATTSRNFPTLNPGGGAYYQGAIGDTNGASNAFILQFTSTGIRKWATYYGGTASTVEDGGNSIYSDGKNVWVTGLTSSANFPTFNPGGGAYFQGTFAGIEDAFILQFNTSGIQKWGTYIGGTSNDFGISIQSDSSNIWVTGFTKSTNFPTLNPGGGAYFQGTLRGTLGNPFILKFDTVGSLKWGTYYGGSGSPAAGADFPCTIQSDGTSVWVGGSTTSTDFPVYDPGCGTFFQSTLGSTGGQTQDPFILQFSTTGVLKWATYYGVDEEDDGSFVYSDGTNLFIGGDADYPGYPLVNPGGGAYYSDTLKWIGGSENLFIGKFCITCSSVPNVTTTSPVFLCPGNSVTLSAKGATTYTWLPASGLSSDTVPNPVANPSVTTTYTVIGNTGGCTDTAIINVIVYPTLSSIVCCDTTITAGSSTKLNVTPVVSGDTYNWIPSNGLSCITCPNPIASPTITTTYYVTIIDSAGCSKTDTVTIDVECGNLFVPDAFSPNGDGKNDYLYVRDACIKTMDFVIYDRWGNKVFETNDINMGWDGTYNGKPMNTGTYVYYVKATMYDGTTAEQKGNVALVR